MTRIMLVQPTSDYADEFVALAHEYQTLATPDQFRAFVDLYDPAVINRETIEGYIARRQANSRSEELGAGKVASTDFWLLADGEIVAVSSLRHALNAKLEDHGGHIGYNVRPSQRGKGYATAILKLTLEQARLLGIKRVLVTCHRDNLASAAVIRKNGGVLASEGISQETGEPILRFWIENHA